MTTVKSLSFDDAVSYRTPLAVTQYTVLGQDGEFPVCPRCDVSIEREYMHFCDRCGQMLDWRRYSKATEKKYKNAPHF